MSHTTSPSVLELVDVEKTYPNGVHAVRGVTLGIRAGEVHAVIGENGAGKSTLMKLAYGLERLSAGGIRFQGRPVSVGRPSDAIALGIGMVHQNLMLVPTFTVAENIMLGHEPGPSLRVDRSEAVRYAAELSQTSGLAVNPLAVVADASVGMRQRTEILKALARGAKVLILDEPTAVLTPQEAEDLFAAVRRLTAQGLTVVFISHKLDEVLAIADRVTVMRQGRMIGTWDAQDCTTASLAAHMVGREVDLSLPAAAATPGETVLAVTDLRAPRGDRTPLGPVSFSVRSGEVLGIAGIEDNGQSEIVRILAGLDQPESGSVRLRGTELSGCTVRQIRDAGVAHIPEDRLTNGAALELSIADNLIVDRFDRPPLGDRGLLRMDRIRDLAHTLIQRFRIKTPDPRAHVGSMSGGNMQKVIVAREMSSQPRLILAAHPTRGVDVGAMEFIYSEVAQARDAGAAVLLLSADLTELLELSDRLLVIREGRLVGHFPTTEGLSEERVGRFMLGVETHDDQTLDWRP